MWFAILFLVCVVLWVFDQKRKERIAQQQQLPESICIVKLMYVENKIQTIKIVREYLDLNLSDAKEKIEAAPIVLSWNMPYIAAVEMKNKLKTINTHIEIC